MFLQNFRSYKSPIVSHPRRWHSSLQKVCKHFGRHWSFHVQGLMTVRSFWHLLHIAVGNELELKLRLDETGERTTYPAVAGTAL
jgi:hypothetical protein